MTTIPITTLEKPLVTENSVQETINQINTHDPNWLFKYIWNVVTSWKKVIGNILVWADMFLHNPRVQKVAAVAGTALVSSLLTGCWENNHITPTPDTPDTEAPKIYPSLGTLEIPEWSTIKVLNGPSKDFYVLVWQDSVKIATMDDNSKEPWRRTVSNNSTSSTPITYITEPWDYYYWANDKAGNKSDKEKLTIKKMEGGWNEPLISWLENINPKHLEINVDQEVNLLNWVTFSDKVNMSSIKVFVEFEWEITEVPGSYPNYYKTFPFPWEVKTIIKFQDINWKNYEESVSNNIKPLEYSEPHYETANLYEINFPWAKYLETPAERAYRKRQLIGAEIAAECAPLNCYCIVTWEDIDDKYVSAQIWNTSDNPDKMHGNEIANRYYQLTGIKPIWNYGSIENLTKYIYDNYEPGCLYLISGSYNGVDWQSSDEVVNNPYISSFIELLNNNWDILPVRAAWNKGLYNRVYNCDIENWYHNLSSINTVNYKVTTTWYYPGNNFFSTSTLYWNQSLFPEWYNWEENNNYVMSTHCGINIDNTDHTSTTSSFSSPIIIAQIWNAIRIIKDANPYITNVAAKNLVFIDNFKKESMLLVDENGNTISSTNGYTIDFEKIANEQVLHLEKIKSLQLNSTGLTKIEHLDDKARIYGAWLGFLGDDWLFHPFTDDNINLYNPDNVYFSGEQYRKYWLMWWYATMTMFIVDRYWKMMEDTKQLVDLKIY